MCSNADPVEGGVVWRKAAEERDVCLGVCVCVKGGGIIILWVLVQGVGSS